MTRRTGLLLVSATLVLAGCGNKAETAQQKATTYVCNARAAIGTDVNAIQASAVTPATPGSISSRAIPPPFGSIQHIALELGTIRNSARVLPPAFRAQVQRTATGFAVAFVPVSKGLRAAPAGAAPPAQYKLFTTAQTALGTVYKKTLGSLTCP